MLSFRPPQWISPRLFQSMHQRLAAWLSEKGSDPLRRGQTLHEIDSPPKGQTPFPIGTRWRQSRPIPNPLSRPLALRVRRLEPRFVLNASAELNALGQLLILGDADAEVVELESDSAGNLSLRDLTTDSVIPIAGHPDGPGGATNPLDPAAITSNQIIFDMGGGDDHLNLPLPPSLDLTVADSDGDDVTALGLFADDSPGSITVNSESIFVTSSSPTISTVDTEWDLRGDVGIGLLDTPREWELNGGGLTVAGRLILADDSLIRGDRAEVDLSSAVITAAGSDASLIIDLQGSPDGNLAVGGADDSGGSFLQGLGLRSPSSITFTNAPTVIAGDLFVVTEVIDVDTDIDTSVGDGNVNLFSTSELSVTSGAAILSGDGQINIDGVGGSIDLGGGTLQSENSDDAITIRNANEVILGDVLAPSGIVTLGIDGDIAADINQSPDSALIADRLIIETAGSVDLTNPANQLGTILHWDVDGDIAIDDSTDDLTIVNIDSRGRNVILATSQSVSVGRIEAGTADVRLTATTIDDASVDEAIDIIGARVFLTAGQGIGDSLPLELMSVAELQAVSDTGDIRLAHFGDAPIELALVTAIDGSVAISSTSTMIATRVSSGSPGVSQTHDLRLTTSGLEADILISGSAVDNSPIVETFNGQVIIAAADGDVTITDASSGDDGPDWNLDPEIVARGEQGRIDIESPGQIELGDDVQLRAHQVTTRYPDPVSISDPVASEPTRDERAVFLKSERVVFGERVEINTGTDQGVARYFAPRPSMTLDRTDPDHPKPAPPQDPAEMPALFDPFTVDTSILTQAVVNDATGILSLDLGREGERGMTVEIDWGAPSDAGLGIGQFQQLNGLSADASIFGAVTPGGVAVDPVETAGEDGLLRVEHFYTQEMILESRENGRTAATDPLEVRFAVRHHDSIRVEADFVRQHPSAEEFSIESGIVSSTDDALINNSIDGTEIGQAAFIIPSLSIPVAFFPVRDVIPELETPEFIVRDEVEIPLIGGTVEAVQTAVATSIGRDEFFQIRVISADPDGEDLAPPQRLPDDILAGDKLQRLLQEVPDGRYEIEYVLGDGNERTILRVDVRGGETTIPDVPLEAEGELELEPIEFDGVPEPPEEQVVPDEPVVPQDAQQREPPSANRGYPAIPIAEGVPEDHRRELSSVVTVAGAAAITGRRLRHRPRRLSLAGRMARRYAAGGAGKPPVNPAFLIKS